MQAMLMELLKSAKGAKPSALVKVSCVALVILLNVALLADTQCSNSSLFVTDTSWIGNTFGGADGKWVGMDARGMHVTPDGTVYTNTFWEEGGKEAGIYKDGDALGQLNETHGWGRLGGYAVTANSNYVYATLRQGDEVSPTTGYPPKGTTWYGVRRYDTSGTSAPFDGGDGYDNSILIIESLTSGTADIRGLAANDDRLYVSDYYNNEIKVYDANTLDPINSWPVDHPRQLVADADGSLWVAQGADGTDELKVLHYSNDGTLLPQLITGVEVPAALAVDNQGRLLVADDGSDQQIKIYDDLDSTPKLVSTLGERGGIFSDKPGEVRPLKFNGLTGVGSDDAGNIYVSYNGTGPNLDPKENGTGLVLQSYSPTQQLNWELLGLEFVDNADVDPSSDGQDVYTKNEHFEMDFSKPSGQQGSYVGYTINRFKYPEDPRLNLGRVHASAPFFRRIQGKPFLFVTDQFSHFLQVYRFDPTTDGEVGIPSSLLARAHYDNGGWPPHQPAEGEWIWRDSDGDGAFGPTEYDVPETSRPPTELWGWWVDNNGDVWQGEQGDAGIRHFPLQGLDSYGNPVYTYASMQNIPLPAPFSGPDGGLQRIEYDPEKDVMYLGGYTADYPFIVWGQVGRVLARYDDWSHGNRTPLWQIVVPHEDTTEPPGEWPKAMSIAGDRLFVAYLETAKVQVYDTQTGTSQGTINPGPEVGSSSGWVDIPYGIRAYQRSDSEYLIFVEEDGFAKVIMYRLDDEE